MENGHFPNFGRFLSNFGKSIILPKNPTPSLLSLYKLYKLIGLVSDGRTY